MKSALRLSLAAALIASASVPAIASTAVGIAQPDMSRDHVMAKGMRVIITGSGSALADPERGGASVAVVVDGTTLQFDMGRGVLENGMKAGLVPTDIDYVFLTHHHFDHIANFGYFVISDWIGGRQDTVQVYGPDGTQAMARGTWQEHAGDIAFGHDVFKNWPADAPGRISPEPPFQIHDAQPGQVVKTANFTVTAMQTIHYTYPGATGKSFAYRVDSPYGSVVISGDTSAMEEMAQFAKGADILIHEVQRPDPGMVTGGKMSKQSFSTTATGKPRHGGGHTSPSELGKIAGEAGVKMLVATHLAPFTSGDAAVRSARLYTGNYPGFGIWGDYMRAMAAGYPGKIVIAEDAMEIDVGAASQP